MSHDTEELMALKNKFDETSADLSGLLALIADRGGQETPEDRARCKDACNTIVEAIDDLDELLSLRR